MKNCLSEDSTIFAENFLTVASVSFTLEESTEISFSFPFSLRISLFPLIKGNCQGFGSEILPENNVQDTSERHVYIK